MDAIIITAIDEEGRAHLYISRGGELVDAGESGLSDDELSWIEAGRPRQLPQ